jgi:hypothetical protein
MLRSFSFCLAVVATVASPLAAASSPTTDETVRHHVQCFVATSALIDRSEPVAKTSGLLASNFFAGQIFGAAPDIDFEAALRREVQGLDDAKYAALLKQCGAEMQNRGKQIQAAAAALEAAPPPPPPKPSS